MVTWGRTRIDLPSSDTGTRYLRWEISREPGFRIEDQPPASCCWSGASDTRSREAPYSDLRVLGTSAGTFPGGYQ